MGKLKLMTIIGTRPEIIRLSATIKCCDRYFEQILVHTGQNYDYTLNQVFFDDLGLRAPDYYLDAVGDDLGATIGNIIEKSYKLMVRLKPDAVLVLGDTNSCLSVIGAKRLHIPIFHMEAGALHPLHHHKCAPAGQLPVGGVDRGRVGQAGQHHTFGAGQLPGGFAKVALRSLRHAGPLVAEVAAACVHLKDLLFGVVILDVPGGKHLRCLAGHLLGKKFGSWLGGKAEIFGGVILVCIGAKILVEHLSGG